MTKAKASGSGTRRTQVANACQACRTSKVKCSGKHPTCARCSARGVECVYDVSEEGMTKRQHLRQEYTEQRRELENALTILDILRSGTDQEATETLARLRLGQTLDQAYDEIVNVRGWRRRDIGATTGDDQSVPDTPQTGPFEHQGPYPTFDHALTSAADQSAVPSGSNWPQQASSSAPDQLSWPPNEPQQHFGAYQPQASDWQSPISPDSQSTTSEWSSIGLRQFEPPDILDDRLREDPSGGVHHHDPNF